MTVALAMLVRDEAAILPRCLESARELVDSAVIVDTGSSDDTLDLARGFPGATVHSRDWIDFGQNRTGLADLARDAGDWLLTLDADMTIELHPGFGDWLATDPDPNVDAWMVEVLEAGDLYRLPLLIRADRDWRYIGATHEYLDLTGRQTRWLLGLTVHHHADGTNRAAKFHRDLELLRADTDANDPRAIFYTAESLRFLGETDAAIAAYRRRVRLGGFEEETWYAGYQAARLSEDIPGLLAAFEERPWRHEPLSAAARLAAAEGSRDDMLFLESCRA